VSMPLALLFVLTLGSAAAALVSVAFAVSR
jgi:hypothetical protein